MRDTCLSTGHVYAGISFPDMASFIDTYAVLSELLNKGSLVFLSKFVCLHSLHID